MVCPLPYHNYTGTAVKCPLVYQLFYGGTLLVVLFQLLGIMILDPDSLSTLVPAVVRRQLLDHSSLQKHMAQTWLVLSLNLLSDLLHIILLWHVRSTAPADWSDRKHVLYFYTQQHHQHQHGLLLQQQQNDESYEENNDQLQLDQPHRNRNQSTPGPRDLLERMRCVPDGYDGKIVICETFFTSNSMFLVV